MFWNVRVITMKKLKNVPDVGAPDPELRNSPVFAHPGEDDPDMADYELES